MIEIANQYITKLQQLGPRYTEKDGLGMYDGEEYLVHDCIIDMSEATDVDEAAAVTWGSSATFRRCVIRGAGKLFLCGSGNADKREKEEGKTVTLIDCILEDFGRRGPEVQCGMSVYMEHCLIRNWGDPDHCDVRNFGAWAHDYGQIYAVDCVFWQDGFFRPIGQFFRDICNHIGQAVNDEGLKALLYPSTYLPGVCRGLTASDGGKCGGTHCFNNHWWIKMQNVDWKMDKNEAEDLIFSLEALYANLRENLTQ